MLKKQNIINKIKSISDSGLLEKLEKWLDEVLGGESEGVEEEREPYDAKPAAATKQEHETNALKWLQKIAEQGGVSAIKDPVEWQKKERRDRSLPKQ